MSQISFKFNSVRNYASVSIKTEIKKIKTTNTHKRLKKNKFKHFCQSEEVGCLWAPSGFVFHHVLELKLLAVAMAVGRFAHWSRLGLN